MQQQKKAEGHDGKAISRRHFLKGTSTAVAAFTIVPRHVLGGPGHTPPSERLNIAGIGVGGRGEGDVRSVAKNNNIVALCDVDFKRAAKTFDKHPNAKKYKDFRRMLSEMDKQIDAVTVATADHTHAVAAMTAMKMGKHVYVEKPLTHSIYEARMLTEAARKYGVATQMGNQGHSSESVRLVCEWVWDGAIGPVREVHVWTNRPIWPQGIDRPKETPPTPATLDWDLWLGPAPERPYNPKYLPFVWRGWWDFGTGALGDMGCHNIDAAFWALKLGQPTSVQAISTPTNDETAPLVSKVDYEFPARGDMPPVKMTWYDGGLKPAMPAELETGRDLPANGSFLVGDKGVLMTSGSPRLIPEEKMQDYKRPDKTIPRVEGHHQNWIDACKGGPPAGSNFDYAGPLTELVLLGNVAVRTGRRIEWDAKNMKVTNIPEANKYVRREYREGWTL